MSVDDYLASEKGSPVKREYVGGHVYAMAGARNRHNQIVMGMFAAWHLRLRGKPCQPFNSDTKVRIVLPTHSRFYYPDGMIVCHENSPFEYHQDHPVVIAEVLSKSTRRIDEGEKRDAYFSLASLRTYLLIESEQARVVAYRRTDRGFVPEVYDSRDAVVSLPEVAIEMPLAEVYERADFSVVEEREDDEEFLR